MREKANLIIVLLVCMFSTRLLVGQGGLQAEITLDKNSEVAIVLSSKPSETETYAASELQKFVDQMIGLKIPIKMEGQNTKGILIFIGRCNDTEKYLERFDKAITGPGSDSFLIQVKDNRIILIGGGDRGTLYSVYAFLEMQGCRWFVPGELGEVIPTKDKLIVNEREDLEVPDFIQREIQGAYTPESDEEKLAWHARNRINRENDLTIKINRADPMWRKRGGYLNWSRLFHNYQFILPPDKYFKDNPEYYPLYKGKRIETGYNKGTVCTTNLDVIRIFVEYINNWFDDNPEGSVFSLWPPDGEIKWCECPQCIKLGGRNFTSEPGAMSRRHIIFANEIAKQVYKKHPDRLILLCVYHPNYLDPVMDMKLEKNVIVQIIHFGCHAHAINKCAANAIQKSRFENWTKIAEPRLGSPVFSEIPLLSWDEFAESPRPVACRIIDNLKYIKSLGGRYYYAQTGSLYEKKNTILYNPFPFYVITKYTWNTETDYNSLCEDFFSKFYGRAGEAMNKYWNLFENAVQNSDWHPEPWSEGAIPSAEVYTPALLSAAQGYLEQAEKAAETDVIKERISYIRQSFDYVKKTVSSRLKFKFERTDDYYILNDGKTTCSDSCHDSIYKKTAFRTQAVKFPVITLQNQRLCVWVVPGIGGRIVKLQDKKTGINFMWEPKDSISIFNVASSYLLYGGYEELVGTQFPNPGWDQPYNYNIMEDNQYQSIVLTANVSGFQVKRIISIEKSDGAEVKIETELTNISEKVSSTGLFIHPVMNINRCLDSLNITMLVKDGSVQKNNINLGLMDQPCGAWAIIDEIANVGIANLFDPAQARSKLHVDYVCNSFNMELISNEHLLNPGQSFIIKNRYVLLDDAEKQLEHVLGMPVNLGKIDFRRFCE